MTAKNEARAELPSFERRRIAAEEVRKIFDMVKSSGQGSKSAITLMTSMGALIEAALLAEEGMDNLNEIFSAILER